MEIFKVEKRNNYIVMPYQHLHDTKLSWTAKGLFSVVLDQEDLEHDYTLEELSEICNEDIKSVDRAIKELEAQGYIKVEKN